MSRLAYLPFVVLLVALGAFGFLADRALAREARNTRESAESREREEARLTALSVRAAALEIEQDLLAERPVPGIRLERASVAPDLPIGRGRPARYRTRSRADLIRLLSSTDTTGQGLPEAVVAAIALGEPERQPEVIDRLVAGLLPVLPADLPYLARVLRIEDDPRVAELARRLGSAPDAASLPAAPSFARHLVAGGSLEGWSVRGRVRLRYEMPVSLLLERAGVGRRARLGHAGERATGPAAVPVPDVEGLVLTLASERARTLGIFPLRILLWAAVVASGIAIGGILAAQRREARAVFREKAFIAGVTHELRTPLAAIRIFGETLADGRGDPREYGALVARESERLESLVERVLAVTRVEEAPSFSAVRPEELVRSALRWIGPRAEGRSVIVESRLDEDLPEVLWDGEAVERALLNLLDNAVKHGREGGRVRVGASADQDGIRLSVSDDGPGIGRREQATVFGRFRRGRTRAPGTGLGLYLVERVARAHGGRVDLVTEESRGCTFTLVLPRTPPGLP